MKTNIQIKKGRKKAYYIIILIYRIALFYNKKQRMKTIKKL